MQYELNSEQIGITPAGIDRLCALALPHETAGQAIERMLEDQATFENRLRPFAHPGETVGQTFGRLMDELKGFLRGLAGI